MSSTDPAIHAKIESAKKSCFSGYQRYLYKPPGEGLGVLYLIINLITGFMYVGQHAHGKSGRSAQKRLGAHFRAKGHSHLYNAIRKYGRSAFECLILDHCEEGDLNEQEIFFVAHLNTQYPNGYNIEKGGGGAARSERGLAALLTANRTPEKRLQCSVPWTSERRERCIPNMKVAQNRPDVKLANSEKSIAHWETPGAREAQGKRAIEWFKVPENTAAISETRKALWATDDHKRRRWAGVLKRRQIALDKCSTDEEREKLRRRHGHADALHRRRGHADYS